MKNQVIVVPIGTYAVIPKSGQVIMMGYDENRELKNDERLSFRSGKIYGISRNGRDFMDFCYKKDTKTLIRLTTTDEYTEFSVIGPNTEAVHLWVNSTYHFLGAKDIDIPFYSPETP